MVAGCGRVNFALHEDAGRDAAPSPIGCSDGEREGFVDQGAFATIAACEGTWNGTPSMRAVRTGFPCGDDLGICNVPADACSEGWHVCADQGVLSDLTSRVSAAQCATAGGLSVGRFVSASGHCAGCIAPCANGESECVYAVSYGCDPTPNATCGEPVCCGPECTNVQNCEGGAFPAPDTYIGTAFASCGVLPGNTQTGVLCCL